MKAALRATFIYLGLDLSDSSHAVILIIKISFLRTHIRLAFKKLKSVLKEIELLCKAQQLYFF
jgi:hypothetical protein